MARTELNRCPRCREFRGETAEITSSMKERLTVSRLCERIVCRRCGRNSQHRPISNYYDEGRDTIIHVPYFAAMFGCRECRDELRRQERGAAGDSGDEHE